jgi:hypothetical protein
MPASNEFLTALAFAPGALNTGTPRAAHGIHRDVVGAGAAPGHGEHRRRDGHAVHVGRAHQHASGRAMSLRPRNARPQALQAARRDLVEHQDAKAGSAMLASNSFMYCTSACTPSIGIAL